MIFKTTPPATTFNEGQRALALILAAGGGIFCGFGIGVLSMVLWLGDWTEATQEQRIDVLGFTITGLTFGVLLTIIGLLIGGPVGRVKAKAGKDGLDVEASGDEEGEK